MGMNPSRSPLTRTALLLTLATLSLAAQDRFSLGLDLASQTGRAQLGILESKQRTQFGLAGAWKVLSQDRMDLHLTGGLRFKAKADVDNIEDGRVATLDHQSVSLGAEVTWHLPLEVGGGLQLRHERLSVHPIDPEDGSSSTNTTRPWLTAHAGWTWKIQDRTPFLRGQIAVPLTHTSLEMDSSESEIIKSLAPKFEVALQVGLRF